MNGVAVRRVREDEWRRVRQLRIEAVSDPDAGIAFLSTPDQERAHDDAFWRQRCVDSAVGDGAAQFIAESDDEWIGTVTVLVYPLGAPDDMGRTVWTTRAHVVGVYVRADHRGSGVIDVLLDAAADWAASRGLPRLTLDVHARNARAQATYRRNGFVPTGETLTSAIGEELVMARSLTPRDSAAPGAPGRR
ncbi:GNAT family N-acetyltransferase [Microbacterium sp. zg.Y1090]|uniref:GNAT family N-acetyltransferase n=1 Tax=Microbacterium TaxID=33882 RepID=UPI00214BD914|nr:MULTISPECIES: GNAT family N-acetyltransferase [unclassified Microbacterium]MCR2811893.1 GNAT family N-acetyltransferase [Microbacterium sp. zg.Y1084]MCR2818668.1 GNAT family N-acetyltransferase [Microbacterium sp. zg.Y1090]MDL5486481.1 GNAT family N-acetyltransferase [Microbacterium sp. zg-Y1211]WIM29665.1 GNAT family N-acetyltransferase [Microbacterium sp. zg-Y1090]